VTAPVSHPERLLGIDVSGWQQPLDWDAAYADGVRFAFVKSSEWHGQSRRYVQHTLGAKDAGVIAGPYHFARMVTKSGNPTNATEQMEKWRELASQWVPGDLPPALDCEFGGVRVLRDLPSKPTVAAHLTTFRFGDTWNTYLGPELVADWMAEALEAADKLFGVSTVLYAGPSFWNGFVQDDRAAAGDRPLWSVDYGREENRIGQPDKFGPWNGDWTFWQQSGSWRADWHKGKLDRNVFNGGLDELLALCGITPCVEFGLGDVA